MRPEADVRLDNRTTAELKRGDLRTASRERVSMYGRVKKPAPLHCLRGSFPWQVQAKGC